MSRRSPPLPSFSRGSGTVLESPAMRASTLMSRHFLVISITAPSAFLDHVREAWGGTGSGPLPVRASPTPCLAESSYRTAHSRPPCRRSVPMLANNGSRCRGHLLTRQIAGSSGRALGRETAEMDTGICWGVLRPRALSTQPYDRHSEQVTPGQPLVHE